MLLAVSYDTALLAAREMLRVPVVGMTEASMHAACLLGTRFGAAAVRAVKDGDYETMVALKPPTIVRVMLDDAIGNGRQKRVTVDSDVMLSARGLGISFGD